MLLGFLPNQLLNLNVSHRFLANRELIEKMIITKNWLVLAGAPYVFFFIANVTKQAQLIIHIELLVISYT